MSRPGAGEADTMYWALPAPVTLPIDQFMLALPRLLTVNVCGAGAAPPQGAEKERADGLIEGPPLMPAPARGSGEGSGAQSVSVAAVVRVSALALDVPVGAKRTASVCVPLGGMVKLGFETVNGAGVEPEADPALSVTVAGALPLFVTL